MNFTLIFSAILFLIIYTVCDNQYVTFAPNQVFNAEHPVVPIYPVSWGQLNRNVIEYHHMSDIDKNSYCKARDYQYHSLTNCLQLTEITYRFGEIILLSKKKDCNGEQICSFVADRKISRSWKINRPDGWNIERWIGFISSLIPTNIVLKKKLTSNSDLRRVIYGPAYNMTLSFQPTYITFYIKTSHIRRSLGSDKSVTKNSITTIELPMPDPYGYLAGMFNF